MNTELSASDGHLLEGHAAVPSAGHYGHQDADETDQMMPERPDVSDAELCRHAAALAASWEISVPVPGQTGLAQRLGKLAKRLESVLKQARQQVSGRGPSPQVELLKSSRMFGDVVRSSEQDRKELETLPHVHIAYQGVLPRIVSIAEAYIWVARGVWSAESVDRYLRQIQDHQVLLMGEIQVLPQALKIAQLEFIVDRAEEIFVAGRASTEEQATMAAAIHSMLRLHQFEWRPLLESLIAFDAVLRLDPGGTFPAMDTETRHAYRKQIATLARRSDFNEYETASAGIELAREAQIAGDPDPRRADRLQHVGYYLFAEGLPELQRRIGYHPPPAERVRTFLLRHNEDFYIIGIMVLSLALIIPIMAPLVPHHEFWPVMLTLLIALVPVSQGAIDLVNGIAMSLLQPKALPKIDYEKGVPEEATTLVAVPTLLLRESQVKELFEDLEGRYLSNEDPRIHFALLTDLPDTTVKPAFEESHPLVQMAVRWTEDLNRKYANGKGGRFFLLHRRREFNFRQGVWMGVERKRGKLLDLNKLLMDDCDNFAIKVGPLEVLRKARYVITLDADTKLPFSAARRMIGTIRHPLNRAIVNPRLGIVTVGYGILQPRVGVSVASASRSRLAAIYSGETGFDIYTRAISDVYQDLFGEGIFTGKGIYEASTMYRVLERRFPRNSLLSHDLIEGAYARAGLVTDVEVIDDYPSQYHAHTRRKHRWIRGDWQILRWLFSPVPDESGRQVMNPISLISKWKIIDNLRRSLVEPVTLLVLVFGWFFLPGGAFYWTPITVALLLLPALVQLGFDLGKALLRLNSSAAVSAIEVFASSVTMALIQLTFLAHQMMLSLDAIVRSMIRSYVSGQRLLEWETAAEAELGGRKSSLDVYLRLSPIVALLLAAGVAAIHPPALFAAGPILLLWMIAPLLAVWLSSPPQNKEGKLSAADRSFLDEQALRIWRYYADFGGPDNHWLIPDHVEERGFQPVNLLTPTNIGMLLNARQAACELGYITVPEFAEATLGSLASFDRLEKHRGHIFNWYDLETLRPIEPVVVSTVDSGNLAASLYCLRAGALDLIHRPLLNLASFDALERIACDDPVLAHQPIGLRDRVRRLFATAAAPVTTQPGTARDRWICEEADRRRAALRSLVEGCMPWLLPEFEPLSATFEQMDDATPQFAGAEMYFDKLTDRLRQVKPDSPHHTLAVALCDRLPEALERVVGLRSDLKTISDLAERFVEEMDFVFLFVESRRLLSNGYDMATHQLHHPCFDLLATEARTAAFLAIAKGDIPQQSWFRMDRPHILVKGRAVLLSWTATMFEYLMPTLWMHSHPDTLLTNSLDAVIGVQIQHVKGMPWGISESGFIAAEEDGSYSYQAWGIPSIALKYGDEDGPVISPYSTFLALPLAPRPAMANLRRMAAMGWVGEYGFYEAADYIRRDSQQDRPVLVRSWMAHHQGMSLLAITNVLRSNVFQTWFHANPRVRAAEQLLHEKPLSKEMVSRLTVTS